MFQALFGLRGSKSDQELHNSLKRNARSGENGRQPALAEPPTKRLAVEAAQPDSLSEATSTNTNKAHGSSLAARFSGNWEHCLDYDESGAVFFDVDSACFQQILQYLRLRANLSHPVEEVPQPHVPSDRFFTYANVVKFFCLEEYMGYWSKDAPDFQDVQPGVCVLGQQAMVTADDLQIRTMYIGEPMQAKQTYHVKFRVDKACQVVGICEQANDGPMTYVGHCVYYATASGWEADIYTGYIFSDGMGCKQGGTRYPESCEDEDEDNDVQDNAAWTTETEVILRADLVDGTLTLQSSQLPFQLSMKINIPNHHDTVLRFQVMLGPSAKVDLLPVTNLEISRMRS